MTTPAPMFTRTAAKDALVAALQAQSEAYSDFHNLDNLNVPLGAEERRQAAEELHEERVLVYLDRMGDVSLHEVMAETYWAY